MFGLIFDLFIQGWIQNLGNRQYFNYCSKILNNFVIDIQLFLFFKWLICKIVTNIIFKIKFALLLMDIKDIY